MGHRPLTPVDLPVFAPFRANQKVSGRPSLVGPCGFGRSLVVNMSDFLAKLTHPSAFLLTTFKATAIPVGGLRCPRPGSSHRFAMPPQPAGLLLQVLTPQGCGSFYFFWVVGAPVTGHFVGSSLPRPGSRSRRQSRSFPFIWP